MGKLHKALKEFFGDECILEGNSIKEQNRVFGIRKNRNDQVVGLRVDGCLINDSSERCDGLFFVWRPSIKYFAIVMVELKGSDTAKAASQFTSTAQYLVKFTKCNQSQHSNYIRDNFSFLSPLSHHSCLVAVAVSRKGLPQSLDTKRRLEKKHRIRFRQLKPTEAKGVTVDKILEISGGLLSFG